MEISNDANEKKTKDFMDQSNQWIVIYSYNNNNNAGNKQINSQCLFNEIE